ncbi:MAG: cobalamin-dependent protein [Myxococcales bacterium]|nr:cobalamin-dependent protein [Myxococcales bacterium]MCB9575936.1 cobalamin B12-binding domain-containing protein [Polyangiaceae bacterium]
MRVLLVNPNREHMPWPTIPVGLCTVASAAEAGGHEVRVLDLSFAKDLAAEVDQALSWGPEVVGITIRNLDNCNFEMPEFFLTEVRDQIVKTLRRRAPEAVVVVGGSAVNVSPGDVFSYLEADYALVGEGEEAFVAFLSALSRGQDVGRVPGVLSAETKSPERLPVLDTGRLLPGEPRAGRAVVKDLERAVRSRAFRWVDIPRYREAGTPYPIQTKRGCALKCVYCVYNNIEGHAYRLRDPADVVDEIEEAAAHGVTSFDFVDSTFNLPLSHARALCDELEKRKLGVDLSTMGLNPAGVTPELVASMKRAGFSSVMCTPESASETTLRTLGKGFSKKIVERAARALRQAELPTYWFFMLGAPEETIETVRETLAFCEEHIPAEHMVLFSTGIRVYAGTPLERLCKETGWFDADDPLFFPSWYFSPELDIDELYDTLAQASDRHPNWMTNAETVLSLRAATFMKRAFRFVGWEGPFWLHLPKVFRVSGLLGARSKGLRQIAERLRAVPDVAHHQ